MVPTFKTDTFAVFDDFLGPEDLRAARRYMTDENFVQLRYVRRTNNSYRLIEGDPLVGPPTYHGHPRVPKGFSSYPSGKSLDVVVEALLGAEESLATWIGLRGSGWDFFSCTPYLYPAGSGLSWHDDAKDRTASFVLYVHDEWKSTWGAELLIATDVGDRKAAVERHQGINTDLGHYVAAEPNRLVVIRAGTPHAVRPVSPRAGENLRMSVTGFFEPLPQSTRDDR
ncbi:2OG-Fe(II) oxygenase [Streptomyces sp. J2-1]|uniref:2OG-Fe(II) oxygenase n=1 Tax=Streptomyces corallincola TaxID=2851888 RepID=UPI001C381822|nr:2OG-Fe(II) oxygenase [Streptomyces corallincola]MBV2354689.1 2OG-Fe(II) oxygenase [Streptomyces corallincola]